MPNFNMIDGLMDDVIGRYDGYPTVVTLRDDSGEIVVDLSDLETNAMIFLNDGGFFSKEGEDHWENSFTYGVELSDSEMAAFLNTIGGGKLSFL